MRRGIVTLLCALALGLGIAAPAFADNARKVDVKPTDVKADVVVNYDGYCSLEIEPVYEDPEMEYPLIKNPQAALMDSDGNLVFPYKDTFLTYWVDDGVISLTYGNPYIQCYLDGATPEEALCKGGFFALDGTPIAQGDYYGTSPMLDGHALVTEYTPGMDRTMKTYVIDRTGAVTKDFDGKFTEVVDLGARPYFDGVWSLAMGAWYSEGLVNCWSYASPEDYVSGNVESYFYMDMNGDRKITLSPQEYSNLYPFYDGLACVQSASTGKYGYIDTTGKLVIPCQYDSHQSVSDGLIGVSRDGKAGYIDKQGDTVIPFEYDEVYGAGDGLASVVKDGRCGLVDYDGNVVVPLEYDDITSYVGGVAYGIKDGTVSVITVGDSTPRYDVRFDANGWGVAPAAQSVAEGGTVREPVAPAAIGYAFGGWYTDEACTDAYDFSRPVTADVTLYAKWTRNVVPGGGTEIYRMYNPYSFEHFFTDSPVEANTLWQRGWTSENVGWIAPTVSDTPIYRLSNPWTHEHFFTTSREEYDQLDQAGWDGENVALYSADETGVPAYRLFNPYEDGPAAHIYTISEVERDSLEKAGYRYEGIGWYGLSDGQ